VCLVQLVTIQETQKVAVVDILESREVTLDVVDVVAVVQEVLKQAQVGQQEVLEVQDTLMGRLVAHSLAVMERQVEVQ
jgi:hypothetical protein